MAQVNTAAREAQTPAPLEGLRIIDFGQYLSGPLAAMLLADSGAEVIRIDPPGGPRWKTPANAILQRGKRSIVLDLKKPGDLQIARALIASADAVIENFRPGVMDRLGVGAKTMTEANPGLVYCSIPAFGEDDPRADRQGWEPIVAAAAGLFRKGMFGFNEYDPFYSPMPFTSVFGGLIGAHSLVAALIGRHKHGRGQRIEAPLFEAAYQIMGYTLQQVADLPTAIARPNRNAGFRQVTVCGDGNRIFFTPPFSGRARFIKELMPPEVEELSGKTDPESEERMRTIVTAFFAQHPAKEWERIGQAIGAGVGVVQTPEEWMNDPHALDSRGIISLDDPELGESKQMGHPIELDKTPLRAQGPRHLLDSDRDAILAELASPRPSAAQADGAPSLPLQGVRVVDTSQILAGPTATRLLAEYGAEVIKINNPRPENINGMMGHVTVNAGKRSILLDLKAPEGKDILWRILENTDIFHQNFAVGVAERLGFGEDQVRAKRPDIIYSSINTHAHGGFRAEHRGHEELGQAATGMALIHRDDQGPAAGPWPVNDHCTGHLSAFAMLLALYHRLKTGEGQHVRASLSGSATFLMTPYMISYKGGSLELPVGGAHVRGLGPLNRLYEAADGWIYLYAVGSDDLQRLAKVESLEGVDKLADDVLERELETRFKKQNRSVWRDRLLAEGVHAQPHATWEESFDDPIVQARGVTVVRQHPGLGAVRRVASTPKLSATPLGETLLAPAPGWDTQAVLQKVGYGERFDELLAAGVVRGPQ